MTSFGFPLLRDAAFSCVSLQRTQVAYPLEFSFEFSRSAGDLTALWMCSHTETINSNQAERCPVLFLDMEQLLLRAYGSGLDMAYLSGRYLPAHGRSHGRDHHKLLSELASVCCLSRVVTRVNCSFTFLLNFSSVLSKSSLIGDRVSLVALELIM